MAPPRLSAYPSSGQWVKIHVVSDEQEERSAEAEATAARDAAHGATAGMQDRLSAAEERLLQAQAADRARPREWHFELQTNEPLETVKQLVAQNHLRSARVHIYAYSPACPDYEASRPAGSFFSAYRRDTAATSERVFMSAWDGHHCSLVEVAAAGTSHHVGEIARFDRDRARVDSGQYGFEARVREGYFYSSPPRSLVS